MTNKYTSTTQQIKELFNNGMNSYDIVVAIVDDWDMSAMRASVMVDYVLKEELYNYKEEVE